jgi:small ubiquitin-related modifier
VGIKVRGQDGTIVHFKVLRTSDLKKVADAYAQRQGRAPEAYLFVFEGNDIFKHNAAVTPDDLEMEDGEMIDAMLEQGGGGLSEDEDEDDIFWEAASAPDPTLELARRLPAEADPEALQGPGAILQGKQVCRGTLNEPPHLP